MKWGREEEREQQAVGFAQNGSVNRDRKGKGGRRNWEETEKKGLMLYLAFCYTLQLGRDRKWGSCQGVYCLHAAGSVASAHLCGHDHGNPLNGIRNSSQMSSLALWTRHYILDGEPNDRMIGKLCDYASKNPIRIPKITNYLEQRFYKELRNEHFSLAKVVPCVYRKLLASCKEQMFSPFDAKAQRLGLGHFLFRPLYATSLLSIVQILLDQTQQDDMCILGCLTLVDFLNNQVDSTYMFNVEGFIPKLCGLSREVGEDDRGLRLRSAGLQALSSMSQVATVLFMGEYSHISMNFDDIVEVILDNYEVPQIGSDNSKHDFQSIHDQNKWAEEVVRVEDNVSSFQDSWKKVLTVHQIINVELDATVDLTKCPAHWSKVCLHNMSKLAKEATTVRRVLDPLFRKLDSGRYWSPEKGVACSVLSELQVLMENSGQNNDMLISTLIKHLDHKNTGKQLIMQVNIVNVAAHLTLQAKLQASLSVITSISDLTRHLRKCLQFSIEASNMDDEDSERWNSVLHFAVENCIRKLVNKVGDVGPIIDMMAVLLENIPTTTTVARATVSSVYRTCQLVASIPDLSYQKKAFPDALFHQLLLAMSHPEHDIRVGSHRIFSSVLTPTIVCPWSTPVIPLSFNGYDPKGTHLVALSGYASSRIILEKLRFKNSDVNESLVNVKEKNEATGKRMEVELQNSYASSEQYRVDPCQNKSQSMAFLHHDNSTEGNATGRLAEEVGAVTSLAELILMRLSSHQLGLLLSSIWVQAMSPENTPANFEALAHTCNLVLLFSRTKNSSHVVLVRCFQLAFSLRKIALEIKNPLQPSRRRCLYTLTTSMLIFSARVGDIPDVITSVKMDTMVDPHLCLIEEGRLQETESCSYIYGSEEDDIAAMELLEKVENDTQLKEAVISQLTKKFESLPKGKLICVREQMLQEFSPDDTLPTGAPLFMETSYPSSPLFQNGHQSFEEVMTPTFLEDADPFSEAFRRQSDGKMPESMKNFDVLNVNQLIESMSKPNDDDYPQTQVSKILIAKILSELPLNCETLGNDDRENLNASQEVNETARQVASSPTPTIPVPYDQMKSQCEALMNGKKEKMSVLRSFKQPQVDCRVMPEEEIPDAVDANLATALRSIEEEQALHSNPLSNECEESFRLPAATPYDKFLKAAGC
ncbi:hypothetical protein ZIOFF_020724 [Zingiber officinale]|uniref:ARM repeat superfamily protein n=1 Tax=Zingiber officinale TaxID=94328 RepID=A0A8J5LLJ0_ZINOF|nr:hypothetical protein ZIOFF_020724 [Zingiber officinale]